MFFQPVIPIILVALALIGVSVWRLIKAGNKRARIQWMLRLLTVILLGLTALRPSINTLDGAEVYNSRYDVYFVVDLTTSMAAEDWQEGEVRLDGIKRDINNLLDDYIGAKFALITFNNSANVRVPLTPDSTALATSVNTLLPEVTQYSQGSRSNEAATTLEKAIADSQQVTGGSDEEERAKIVLYFGDGEETSDNPKEGEGDFTAVGKQITSGKVYGYGTEEGGKMKVQTGYYIASGEPEYITDGAGEVGLSIIDEENLQRIAEELGGEYEHRTADTRISPVELTTEELRSLQKTEDSSIQNTAEFYWVFLIPLTLVLFLQAGFMFRNASRLGVIRNGR